MKSYITLNEIVKSLLIQMGEQDENKFYQLFDIGIRGAKELAFDTTQEVKVAKLSVNDNLTVDLPCDYINYRRIGVCSAGELKSLGLDAEMCIPTDFDSCGDSISYASSNLSNLNSVYWTGAASDGVYGLGGGNNIYGFYKIDKEANQIVLSSDFSGTEIVLEYISDGSTSDGEYQIHVFAEEALRSYVWWKHLQRKRNVNANEKMMARKDWYNEKRIATARFSYFNKEEALQASRKHNKQSPKF